MKMVVSSRSLHDGPSHLFRVHPLVSVDKTRGDYIDVLVFAWADWITNITMSTA